MAINYTNHLTRIGSRMYSCSCCGRALNEDDLVVDCADCGAIFCEECVRDGEINSHECEVDDFEEGN